MLDESDSGVIKLNATDKFKLNKMQLFIHKKYSISVQ